MVPETGLEPARLAAYAPKAYVYTNFTTRAYSYYNTKRRLILAVFFKYYLGNAARSGKFLGRNIGRSATKHEGER